jgi:hypothetical protein
MSETICYRNDLDVRYEAEVVVAGGGPAGIAAALAAARQGRSVRLIEAHSCLGGMGTAGMVPAFMQFSDGINFLAGGIGQEILDALRAGDGTVPPDGMGIRAEILKRVYEEMLLEAGVEFTYHTRLVDVTIEDGRVREVVCAGKSGLFAARAGSFVDGTGDGDLAVFAGAKWEKGDAAGDMMAGTLCSLWAGVDWEKVYDSGLGTGGGRLEEAFRDGVFTVEDPHLPGMWRVGEALGGGNIGHTFGVDGTDEESMTDAFVSGRRQLQEYERYYRDYLEGFEEMELAATGSLLGIRETRRIMGDYVLNVDDFRRRAVFEDEIGRYSYPVDLHAGRPGRESYEDFHQKFQSLRMDEGESYGIPYRILTPKGLKNVLVAGRCVSTDRDMLSSIRVMPGCYITGQAAGVAAAMAADGQNVHEVDVDAVQGKLKEMGAYLPNF